MAYVVEVRGDPHRLFAVTHRVVLGAAERPGSTRRGPTRTGEDRGGGGLLRRVTRIVWKQARARYPETGCPTPRTRRPPSQRRRPGRLPLGDEHPPPSKRRRRAFLEGFSLHADTWVHAHETESLERLCRPGARGPLALQRLTRRDDGTLEYRLKEVHPRRRHHPRVDTSAVAQALRRARGEAQNPPAADAGSSPSSALARLPALPTGPYLSSLLQ